MTGAPCDALKEVHIESCNATQGHSIGVELCFKTKKGTAA